jgi:phosphoglycolate phosphatase
MHISTPTIVFDLDGTLVHTVPDIAAALDTALSPYAAAKTTSAEAATMMGDGLSEFFWRALVAKRLDLPALEADATRKRFIDAYRKTPAVASQIYPGIRELLHDLRALGVLTAVCTNKIEDIALDILDDLKLHDLFDSVVGFRDDRPMKPHPHPLQEAVMRAGGSMAHTLLVGDTGADNGAAIAAGIPVVLVGYGYSAMPIRSLNYGTVVEDVAGLRKEVMSFTGSTKFSKTGSPAHRVRSHLAPALPPAQPTFQFAPPAGK